MCEITVYIRRFRRYYEAYETKMDINRNNRRNNSHRYYPIRSLPIRPNKLERFCDMGDG